MKYVVGLISKGDEFLFLERSDNEVEGGKFGLVGGLVEKGERHLDAIIREVFEETKLVIDRSEIIYVGEYTLPFNGKNVEFILYKYNLDKKFEPKLDPQESKGFIWTTLKRILKKENLTSGLRELIEMLSRESIIKKDQFLKYFPRYADNL